MKNEIEYAPSFFEDLEQIRDYIALDCAERAYDFAEKLLQELEVLTEYPLAGVDLQKKVKVKLKYQYKYLVIKGYYVFYLLREDSIFVLHIINGGRDFMKILQL